MKNKVKLISASAGFPSPAENYVEEKLNLNMGEDQQDIMELKILISI